jgi:nucleoside-diphosphate kinase
MEKTLIILKPDCMQRGLAGTVLARLMAVVPCKLVGCKMLQLHSAILKDHYAHLATKPFFPEIEAFMSQCPVLVCVLQGPGIVQAIRDALGPTDSTQAPKGSIRGDYGQDKMHNIAHASDSTEAADQEVRRFFNPHEVFLTLGL